MEVGEKRDRVFTLPLFCCAGERGRGGTIGRIGKEGCIRREVSMLCVCNYTEESTEGEEKVSAPVVRNKR